MNEDTALQSNNRPWLFKKGQSGNPSGKPKGAISLKTWAKKYLQELTDEEKLTFIEGLNKVDIWKLAEGNPDTKSELKVTDELKPIEDDIKTIKTVLGLGTETTDSAGS